MKRLLLGAMVALALAVPVTLIAAPPKTVNVVTPMKQDLDANGFNITDAGGITATGNITSQANIQTSSSFVGGSAVLFHDLILEPPDASVIALTAGSFDPAAQGLDRNPGSVYLRGSPGPAQAWLHTGTDPHAWTCFAGCT